MASAHRFVEPREDDYDFFGIDPDDAAGCIPPYGYASCADYKRACSALFMANHHTFRDDPVDAWSRNPADVHPDSPVQRVPR